jgi:3-oxoadipate CoA-transferase beta subunit
MIRGGHIDYCVLGAMEISVKGDLANWSTGKGIPAVGGAMDLVAGAKNVFVMTQHLTKEGKSKLVKECSLPLTGANVVSRVYSDYAVMEISDMGFKVLQLNTNISLDYLKSVTEGNVYE